MSGNRTYFKLGDCNAICYVCGFKRKASEMKQRWDGVYCCTEDWEPRHPQDFVRSTPVETAPPWTQPPSPSVYSGPTPVQLTSLVVGTPTLYSNGVALTVNVNYTIELPLGRFTFLILPAANSIISWTGTWIDNSGTTYTYTTPFVLGAYQALSNTWQIYGN